MRTLLIGAFLSLHLASLAVAETTSSVSTLSKPPSASLAGQLDLRPGLFPVDPSTRTSTRSALFGTYDTTAAGVAIGKWYFGYAQWWWTKGRQHPFESVQTEDGFVHIKGKNLWSDKRLGLSFTYETRAYLPTYAPRREAQAGLVPMWRNYLTLKKTFSPLFALTLQEVAIPQGYQAAGFADRQGTLKANPNFENRIQLIAEVNFTDRWFLSVPVMFHQTQYRNAGADFKDNEIWAYTLWTWPELLYSVDPSLSLGVAYFTDNLIQRDLSGFTLAQGLENGFAHLVMRAVL